MNRVILPIGLATISLCAYQLYDLVVTFPEPLQQAMERLNASTAAKAFGTASHSAWNWDGSLQSHRIHARVPVSSSSGHKGELFVQAVKIGEKWELLAVELLEDGKTFDVLRDKTLTAEEIADIALAPPSAPTQADANKQLV